MTSLPLHPAIVHVPLGLAFVVPLVAIALAIAHARGFRSRPALAVLLGLQLALVAGGGLALTLGERDEKTAERVVSEQLIEEHEERAEVFVGGAAVVAAAMIAALVVPAGAATALSALVAAGTLAVAGLAFRTGEAGGALVYRHGAATAWLPSGAGAPGGSAAVPVSEAGPADRRAHDDD